jgi:hypothetical protein
MRNMQNLKRMAAVVLALVMVILTVTGCSKSTASEGDAQDAKTAAVNNDLAAPDGIETASVDGAVTILWSAVDGALKYDVYGAGVHAVTVDTSYTFNALAPGEYSVAVRAFGGSRSSEASKVTFVVADSGAVKTTAVDVPELKVESKATSKSDSKADSKKAESTTKTDKAKASTGNSDSSSGNKNSNTSTGNSNTSSGNKDTGSNTDSGKNTGNGNTSTGNNNNANTGNNGSGTNTGGGSTTPTTPAPDPDAGKTYVPEQIIEHPATYKTVFHDGVWTNGTREYGYRCNTCKTEFWGPTCYDDVRAHGRTNEHGGWMQIARTVGAGWITEPWEENVIDQPAWTEVIPAHWK